MSVSEGDASRLAHIVQYSRAQREHSCRCDHLHSNQSSSTFLIHFDSATVSVSLQSSAFISDSWVLSSTCLFVMRGRGGLSAPSETDIGAIRSRSQLMMCPVTVQFLCLVWVLDELWQSAVNRWVIVFVGLHASSRVDYQQPLLLLLLCLRVE